MASQKLCWVRCIPPVGPVERQLRAQRAAQHSVDRHTKRAGGDIEASILQGGNRMDVKTAAVDASRTMEIPLPADGDYADPGP